jgi:tryptophan synthase alpha chain
VTKNSAKGISRLMSHMVAWYPDEKSSMEVAKALLDGGSEFLELQFPFSDPSADGPAIQEACNTALSAGFTTAAGFDLIRKIVQYNAEVPLFVMSYASVVFARGVERFVEKARAAGAKGLIIPDLMPGYDEGLYEAGRRQEMIVIPVVAPDISDGRLAQILALRPAYLYASLRIGITGKRTDVTQEVLAFLRRLNSTGAKILAGFGIDSRSQVEDLQEHVYGLIVGSALVRTITSAVVRQEPVYGAVIAKISGLVGS